MNDNPYSVVIGIAWEVTRVNSKKYAYGLYTFVLCCILDTSWFYLVIVLHFRYLVILPMANNEEA